VATIEMNGFESVAVRRLYDEHALRMQ
jgi:hypothetical protein